MSYNLQDPHAIRSSPKVMIAAHPKYPEFVAHTSGLDAKEIHCTIEYFGKLPELDKGLTSRLHEQWLGDTCDHTGHEIVASVVGAGTLGEESAVVVFIEAPELETAHNHIISAASNEFGYESKYPSFIPHITIGYPEGDDALLEELLSHAMSLVGRDLVLDKMAVHVGDNITTQRLHPVEDVTEVLSPAEFAEIDTLLASTETAWAGEKKLEALLAAKRPHTNLITWHGVNIPRIGPRLRPNTKIRKKGKSRDWNPLLHPRGADGRFINKLGWVKFLSMGKWLRGQVSDIDPSTGELIISDSKGAAHKISPRTAYSTPTPKAMLALPDPVQSVAHNALKGWEQTAGQGGSNPGARYKVSDPNVAKPLFTPALLRALAIRHDPSRSKIQYGEGGDKLEDMPNQAIFTLPDGRLIRRNGNSAYDITNGEYLSAEDRVAAILDPKKTFVGGDHIASVVLAKIAADAEKIVKFGAQTDAEYYVKKSKSRSHAANEILANRLYEAAGVPVPDVVISNDGQVIGSKILPSAKPLYDADTEELARVRSNFAVDAWLANWDVIGLSKNNIVISDGTPMRIDAGGALLYRAQGDPKGQMFGTSVIELDSFKDPYINAQAASIFGDVTDDELRDGASRVAGIHPSEIREMVHDAGLPEDLADKLIARRADLIEKTGIEDPYAGGSIHHDSDTASDFSANDVIDVIDSDKDEIFEEVSEALVEQVNEIEEAVDDTEIVDAPPAPISPDEVIPDAPDTAVVDSTLKAPNLNLDVPELEQPLLLQDLDTETAVNLDGKPVALLLPMADKLSLAGKKTLHSGIFEHDSESGNNFLSLAGVRTLIPKFTDEASLQVLPDEYATHFKDSPLPNVLGNELFYGGHPIGKFNNISGVLTVSSSALLDDGSENALKVWPSQFGSENQMLAHVASQLKPHAPLVTAKKSAAADSIKTTAMAAAKKSYGTLSDGTPAEEGIWVESKKDGLVSQIIEWPNQSNYPKLVKVRSADGVVKHRSLSTLQAVSKPETEDDDNSALTAFVEKSLAEISDAPGGATTTAPSADSPVPTITTEPVNTLSQAVSNPDIPFVGLKTADGKTPQIGMKVKAGKPGKEVEGTLVGINPKNGYATVQDSTGKKTVKTLGTTYVLGEKNADIGDELESVSTGAAIAVTSDTNKPAPKTPDVLPVNAVSAKYPSLTGDELPKPTQQQVDGWLKIPGRKLTKDGYVPAVGMVVRDAKGQRGVVVDRAPYAGKPNSMKVYFEDTNKVLVRSASTLYVDHEGSFTDKTGAPLERIVSIQGSDGTLVTLPHGTRVFATSSPNYMYAVTPTGEAHLLRADKIYGAESNTLILTSMSSGVFGGVLESQALTPIAVFDDDSQGLISVDVGTPAQYSSSRFKPGKPATVSIHKSSDEYNAKQILKAEELAAALDVLADKPEIISITSEDLTGAFSPPAINISTSDVNLGPELPVVTGNAPDYTTIPASIKTAHSSSIADAAKRAIEMKDSTGAGTAFSYAFGDSDYVDDMTFRFQVLRNPVTGEERLEMRFKLRQSVAQELSDTLLTRGSGTGTWVQKSKVSPQNLSVGDYIVVRYSAHTQANKPVTISSANASTPIPNARVAGDPQLYSVNEDGTNIYRVEFITADGKIGHLLLEDRGAPSVSVIDWDPSKSIAASSANVVPTARAMQDGWSAKSGMSLPYTATHNSLTDNTGAAPLSLTVTGYSPPHSAGSTLTKTTPRGAFIRYTGIASAQHDGSNENHNFNGNVFVSIPLNSETVFDDNNVLAISEALETVGIPVAAQGPPSEKKLAVMALNKLVANFDTHYTRDDAAITSASDTRVVKTLGRLNAELSEYLPAGDAEPITLNDILLKTSLNGRTRVVFSPRVANAMSKRQNNTYYRHEVSNSASLNILSNPANGLMSTDERWSAGIMYEGMSSITDLRYGSGDYVFIRAGQAAQYSHSTGIVFHPDVINSNLEIYGFASDEYGRRTTGDANKHLTLTNISFNNERLIKRRIEVEDIAYVVVSNRSSFLEELYQRGVTHIGNRPIEDIVRDTHSHRVPSFGSNEWTVDAPAASLSNSPTTSVASIGSILNSTASVISVVEEAPAESVGF